MGKEPVHGPKLQQVLVSWRALQICDLHVKPDEVLHRLGQSVSGEVSKENEREKKFGEEETGRGAI